MRWYLLRDRRHEGPYSKEQIIEGLKAGTIHSRDYLLPEAAIEDQSSFVYMTISEIVDAEVLFDLKKNDDIPVSSENVAVVDATPKMDLREEFEKGLESNELFQQSSGSKLTSISTGLDPNSSFVSKPAAEGFRFPWKLTAGIASVLLFAGFFLQSAVKMIDSGPDASRSPSATETLVAQPKGASRSSRPQNRVTNDSIQLPSTNRAQEPDMAPVSSGLVRDTEPVEPKANPRKIRKRGRNEETSEEAEAAAEEEGFDQDEEVEEDTSTEEEVVDESDI